MQGKRKITGLLALIFTCLTLFAGCVTPPATTTAPIDPNTTVPTTQNPTVEPTAEPTVEPTEPTREPTAPPTEEMKPEKGTEAYYIQVVYAQCIRECFNTDGWPERTAWE